MLRHKPDDEWSTLKKLMYLQGMGVVNGNSKLNIDLTAFGAPRQITAKGKSPEVKRCIVHFSPSQPMPVYAGGDGINHLKPNVELPITQNGVTVTLEDGVFVFNGTCTADFDLHLDNWDSDYEAFNGSGKFITYGMQMERENLPGIVPPNGKWGIVEVGGTRDSGYDLSFFSTTATMLNLPTSKQYHTWSYLTIKSGQAFDNARIKVGFYWDNQGSAGWMPWENYNGPIYGWTGTTVYANGENLFDEVWEEGGINSATGEDANWSNYVRGKNFIHVNPNEAVFMSWDTTATTGGGSVTVIAYDANKVYTRNLGAYSSPRKLLTLRENEHYIRICLNRDTQLVDCIISYGTTAHDYVPYSGEASYAVIFPYGKNLLDMSTGNIELGKYINNSGTVQSSTSNFYNSKYIPVKPNTKYTISTNTNVSYVSFMEYDESKTFTLRTLFGASQPRLTQATITTRADTAYILIGSNPIGSAITMDDVTAIKWQLEEGENATSYEPYGRVRYAGWVDLKTGDGEATMAMTTFDGSTPSNKLSITVLTGYTQVSYTPYITEGVAGHEFLCSRFIAGSTDGLNHIWGSSVPRMFMGLPDSVTSANDAVAWFADNPTEVCYQLATPIPFHVNPQTFIVEAGKTYWSAEMLSTVDESNLVDNALVDTATVS